MNKKIKIAFCLITKGDDELDGVKNVVSSALPAVTSVHITANSNKTDETKKWCEENGYDFSYLPWNDDFAEQRNYNFARAPKGTDFILWADYDDEIVGAEWLQGIASKALADGLHSVFFTYWYGCDFEGRPSYLSVKAVDITQTRERLLKPNAFYWKGRIHETPIPYAGDSYKYTFHKYSQQNPIVWVHLNGTRESGARSQERNMRILELQLADERRSTSGADPRTLLYLMRMYVEEKGKPELLKEALVMGEEYLNLSGWDYERSVALGIMSRCAGELGDHKKAYEYALLGVSEYPSATTYLYLARCCFNLNKYRDMEHFMKVALSMEVKSDGVTNIQELKVLSAELMLKFNHAVKKNVRKSYEAAVMLNNANPTNENQILVEHFFDMKELDLACESLHKYINYLDSIGEEEKIPAIIDASPRSVQNVPFAVSARLKYSKPKVWGENEICYYASFGGQHFEHWSAKSLERGIGGSETAVIRLAQEWTKLGYKVTVYGDPALEEGEHDGVTYLPWYKFNKKDYFNILIQWRSNFLAKEVNAKQFYVDLHDVWPSVDYVGTENLIDGIFVKSKYHRELGAEIPEKQFIYISNGI